MSETVNPLDAIRPHLETQSSKGLALACILQPHYCRKFLTLERLLELLQGEPAVLAPSRVLDDVVRPEVIHRLLIQGNRARWREPFLRLFREKHLRCPKLYQFVEDSYVPRSLNDFKTQEACYLAALQRLYMADSELREPVADALAWFGALPGQNPHERFGVLFSNVGTSTRFPSHLLAGVCISFAFRSKNGTEPFEPWDLQRLGDSFRRAAVEAELKAHELCKRSFGSKKHRRIRIEERLEDTSFFDGSSGYLAFLMAHLCQLRDLPMSPYIGYTGAFKEMSQLGTVADLPQKLAAAVHAGRYVVFVPQSDFRKLTPQQQNGFGVLRIIPFEDHGTVDRVVVRLVESMIDLGEGLPQPQGSDETAAASSPSRLSASAPPRTGGTPRPSVKTRDQSIKSSPSVDSPVSALTVLTAAQKLFPTGQLRAFLEWGGLPMKDAPAEMSVFSDDYDTFLTLYPNRHRLYLFDAFGNLLEKCATDDKPPRKPLCVTWDTEAEEYLVGFDDGRISRFSPDLSKLLGHYQTPGALLPRHLAAAGQSVFASDGSPHIVELDTTGSRLPRRTPFELSGPVSQIVYAEVLDRLLVSLPTHLFALTRDLQLDWQAPHAGPTALTACGPNGDVWIVTATGRLSRLAADDRRTLVEARTAANACALIPMEKAVLVGTRDGLLLLHDTVGRELARDDLRTELFHMAAGRGDILAISTARGPTVLKPNPHVIRAAQGDDREQALRMLDNLIRFAKEGRMPELTTAVQKIEIEDWRPIVAFQIEFQKRKKSDPAGCLRLEEAVRFHDMQKADCLCTRTRAAFIDGSNVSRDHWGDDKSPGRKARLSAILRMREKLAREMNPVLYPIITVVDVTERHWSDKRADLLRLIDEGVIEATPTEREADALILNYIKSNGWLDCEIISNDKKMFEAHAEMLPQADRNWYQRVRRAFQVNHRTGEITFVEKSR